MANDVRGKWQTWQKAKTTHAKMRTYEADPHIRRRAGHQLHAELRLYLQLSLHETHGLENATCHSTQEQISLWTPHAHYLPGLYGVCGNEHSGALNTITAVEKDDILCLSKRAQTEWVFAPDNAHKLYQHHAKAGLTNDTKISHLKKSDAKLNHVHDGAVAPPV